MDSVNQAQVLESYAPLKADLDMVSHGIYVSELLDSFGVEGSANLTLYDLTCEALRLLGRKETNKGLLLRYFELQTLKLSGFLPELHVCVVCRNRPAVEMTFFSPDGGGLVCGDCRPEGMRLLPLVSGTVEMLRFLETAEPTHAARFSTSAEVQVQLKAVLAATVRYWLDREMRSAAFLDTARDALSQPSEGTDHA
jgi:DNA repair protein RecO (recombination protein O)